MFYHNFDLIFHYLNEIEEKLKGNLGIMQKEKLATSLLYLRNIMDECVKYWLHFEEKINQLQKKYDFFLPDQLPDGFFEEISFAHPFGSDLIQENHLSEVSPLMLESNQVMSSFRKGLSFWDLAMLEEAINEFENIVKAEPNFLFGHLCLGFAYSQKGWHDKALSKLRLIKSLCREAILTSYLHNEIGNIYVKEKKYQEALEEFNKALEEDPDNVTAQFNRGAALYNLGFYQEAVEAFKKVQEILPSDWEVYYCLGKAFIMMKNYAQGLECFKKAFSLNPLEKKILFEMGVLYEILGDNMNAEVCFNRIVKKNN